FAAAMRGFDFGKHVCMVEAKDIGGAGIMHGAMTSKTLWELSKDYAVASAVDRGYRTATLTVDYEMVRDTVIQAAKEKQYQILSQVETFAPPRWKGPGSISLKRGWASFIDQDSIELTLPDGTKEIIRADFFVIATGSKPRDFPGITVDHVRVLNSDDVLGLKQFPKPFLTIGAGVLG